MCQSAISCSPYDQDKNKSLLELEFPCYIQQFLHFACENRSDKFSIKYKKLENKLFSYLDFSVFQSVDLSWNGESSVSVPSSRKDSKIPSRTCNIYFVCFSIPSRMYLRIRLSQDSVTS